MKKSVEIAKNLLKNGVDDEIVQTSTGLSKDEINHIKAGLIDGKF